MIDAYLFAVRDAVRSANFGYGFAECEVMADGHPPPRAGNVFVAVHQGPTRSDMVNALNEYYAFFLTLTMRVTASLDRVGDTLLARKMARTPGPGGQPSFNARAEQLRAFLHMNWGVMQDANTNIANWEPAAGTVYGFATPARYDGMEVASLVGPEWFNADPSRVEVGLKSELRFVDARRLQALQVFV